MFEILNPLINILLHQYFANSSNCFLLVTDTNTTLKIPSGIVVVHTESSYISQNLFHHFGCNNIIMEVENPVEILGIMEKEILKHQESFHSRRYLIVTAQNDVATVFKNHTLRLFCEGLVTNLESGKNVVSLWTLPFTDQGSVLIDLWFPENNTFLWSKTPPSRSNIQKQSIKVGTFNYAPYVLVGKHISVEGRCMFLKTMFQKTKQSQELTLRY